MELINTPTNYYLKKKNSYLPDAWLYLRKDNTKETMVSKKSLLYHQGKVNKDLP